MHRFGGSRQDLTLASAGFVLFAYRVSARRRQRSRAFENSIIKALEVTDNPFNPEFSAWLFRGRNDNK